MNGEDEIGQRRGSTDSIDKELDWVIERDSDKNEVNSSASIVT